MTFRVKTKQNKTEQNRTKQKTPIQQIEWTWPTTSNNLYALNKCRWQLKRQENNTHTPTHPHTPTPNIHTPKEDKTKNFALKQGFKDIEN